MTEKGIRARKQENFSEWYTQVIEKAELIEYSAVSGCIILRPAAYAIWEKISEFFDKKIKEKGVRNAYFPLLIPEELLKRESKHVEGFSPEVAWVTEAGDSKLNERLAIRPTSETIIYETYKKWIRSYRDLPLLLNQWCNVVRWEFKNPVPFIRTREFLWQEGHTAFATREESEKHAIEILEEYIKVYEEILAVPVIAGRKTESEKFAGADITYSIEAFVSSGKAVQAATSHCLGQNFSRAFDIKFLDKDEVSKHVWQNSWGLTTRSIGIMTMVHGDDKGLVIPPRVALNKLVIIPILTGEIKKQVIKTAQSLKKKLQEFSPILDDREDKTPGNKYNYYEIRGIPLRIEIGPKDIQKKQLVIARRDNGEKKIVKINDVNKEVKKALEKMQKSMLLKAKKFMDESIIEIKNSEEFEKAVKNKKIAKAQFCNTIACEALVKNKYQGVKTVNIPFEQPKTIKLCFNCGKKAEKTVLFSKTY